MTYRLRDAILREETEMPSFVEPPNLAGDLAASLIANECEAIKKMLLEKNAAYGNSALDPLRVFSKADSTEAIKVRIDDKLSRLQRGRSFGEDTIADLIGYLVLLRIAMKNPTSNRSDDQ